MAPRNESSKRQEEPQRGDAPNPITKDTLAQWHAALAGAAGQLSGILSRGSGLTPRVINATASMLRPILRDMEHAEAVLLARETVETERAAPRRVQSKRAK